ncbi:RINT-1 family protein-like protein [Amylocarpus encephaloides]|uniref:RINT-1 family protein-like protein n=1 Tax=Amylocarpus encephaloides TaxID=45428 RepID=A0A9P8C3I6_9HELO|nr:RINT-1 family protein-like protein [Amylocarpus encephaloides]
MALLTVPPQRDSTPTSGLLDPAPDIPRGDMEVRLDDWVNDKFQTRSDFGNLSSLVANVETQKAQLEDQLRDARFKLDEAKKASANHTSKMLEQTRQFKLQQDSVQKRLMIVTQSDTPEEATKLFRGPMEKLRRIELARSYVELLKDVDEMRDQARKHLPNQPKDALIHYVKLRELASSMEILQREAEGAAVHLVNYVQNASSKLWIEMKTIMTTEFQAILRRAEWPDVPRAPTREWADCFQKMLVLQSPEIMIAREPLVLLPMAVLVQSFEAQFRYHFFTEKATNTIHRLGDFFLEWFVGIVKQWEQWLQECITPILAAHFRSNILAGNSLYIDPVAAFITALLPIVKEKINKLMLEILASPQLLSRFIRQLIKFDAQIRRDFGYDGGNPEHGWKGLTWDVLSNYFTPWSLAEKSFAITRYHEIINSPDRGQLDYDGADSGKTKPTQGATKVMELLDTVTTQYRDLRRFSHKVGFLIDIQVDILDQYLGFLSDAKSAYMAATTTVGRTLQGISKEEQAKFEGVSGLEKLCRIFGSADHVVVTLHEWSNDPFFVELWNQIQDRAKTTGHDDILAGTITLGGIKRSTSRIIGSQDEGSVFDVSIMNFEHLRKQTEDLLTQAIQYAFPSTFNQYFTKPQWTTVGDELVPNPSDLAITAELDQPLRSLKENIEFLDRTLGYAAFRRIWRASFESLQDLLYREVLIKQDFTSLGAARLMADIDAIQGIIQNCVKTTISGNDLGMPKLREGIKLLNIPVTAGAGEINLKAAYDEIVGPGSQAIACLGRMGFNRLPVHEAKFILRHRVEASVIGDD